MTRRRVRLTETARDHVDLERTWWLKNRDHLAVFATQFERTIEIVAALPGAGTPYPIADTPALRRLFVRKLNCHLYYTFDDKEVIVRAFWGARRERGPVL
jgi:plasmid stabilization system protein ParE